MIIPDANLLIYAYNSALPEHASAKEWWRKLMGGGETIGLAWVVSLAFLRITTQRRIVSNPYSLEDACGIVAEWHKQPNVTAVQPGPRHLELLTSLLSASGGSGNLVTDAHLAALAIENSAEVHTNDSDFARFPDVKWRNPIA